MTWVVMKRRSAVVSLQTWTLGVVEVNDGGDEGGGHGGGRG